MTEKAKHRDYSYLEGKEIIHDNIPAIVAGIEYDVGITVVEKHNKDRYCFCLVNPQTLPVYGHTQINFYNTYFFMIAKKIKQGTIEGSFIERIVLKLESFEGIGKASAQVCAFNK